MGAMRATLAISDERLARRAPPLRGDQIIGEYVAAAKVMTPHADYLMLNLSCPNTENGRDFFADRAHLDPCLVALDEGRRRCPVFLKISPLGGIAAIERVLAAADGHRARERGASRDVGNRCAMQKREVTKICFDLCRYFKFWPSREVRLAF